MIRNRRLLTLASFFFIGAAQIAAGFSMIGIGLMMRYRKTIAKLRWILCWMEIKEETTTTLTIWLTILIIIMTKTIFDCSWCTTHHVNSWPKQCKNIKQSNNLLWEAMIIIMMCDNYSSIFKENKQQSSHQVKNVLNHFNGKSVAIPWNALAIDFLNYLAMFLRSWPVRMMKQKHMDFRCTLFHRYFCFWWINHIGNMPVCDWCKRVDNFFPFLRWRHEQAPSDWHYSNNYLEKSSARGKKYTSFRDKLR